MTIEVLYSCDCGLVRAAVAVPERTEQQDVVEWMDSIGRFIADDHSRRSPLCAATVMRDLMIPMTGRTKIGGPLQH